MPLTDTPGRQPSQISFRTSAQDTVNTVTQYLCDTNNNLIKF